MPTAQLSYPQRIGKSLISPLATATFLTDAKYISAASELTQRNFQWFYRVTSPDARRVGALVRWLEDSLSKDTLIDNVVCVRDTDNNAYADGLWNDTLKILNDRFNGTIRDVQFSSSSQNFVQTVIDRLKGLQKVNAIIIFGNNGDTSAIAREIRKIWPKKQVYVTEPTVNADKKIFFGPEFQGVRAIADQFLWTGDLEASLFAHEFGRYLERKDSPTFRFSKPYSLPTAAAFGYDATITGLSALAKAIRKVDWTHFRQMSEKERRNAVRDSIDAEFFIPNIMSLGHFGANHSALVKLQRSYFNKDHFGIVPTEPTEGQWIFFCMPILGGALAGFLKVLVDFSEQMVKRLRVTDRATNPLPPLPYKGYLGYLLVVIILSGSLGLIAAQCWEFQAFRSIFPQFVSEMSADTVQNLLVIGLVAGAAPAVILSFFSKKSTGA